MKGYIATISSKGQVTLPVDVRRRLGVGAGDKVSFVATEGGRIEVRPVQFSLEDVLGSIEALPGESLDLDREIESATEEAVSRKMQRFNQR